MGIPTAIHYPAPIPHQPAYRQFSGDDDYPVAVEMSRKVMSLPMGPYMKKSDVAKVTDTLLRAVERQSTRRPAFSELRA
jgi:UDP-2-acetamido-2-deoxy-ribo-hexuluronate aminotransferase